VTGKSMPVVAGNMNSSINDAFRVHETERNDSQVSRRMAHRLVAIKR